jgi:hypothetical protein
MSRVVLMVRVGRAKDRPAMGYLLSITKLGRFHWRGLLIVMLSLMSIVGCMVALEQVVLGFSTAFDV